MKVVLNGVLFFCIFWVSGCLESSREAPREMAEKYEGQVVLYSTSWCGYCRKMREFLEQNHIDYVEFDIEVSEDANTEFKRLGGNGIPLVLVKGRVVNGYAPKAVLELIRG